jgi:two-component system sensor histidine kinase KdpD
MELLMDFSRPDPDSLLSIASLDAKHQDDEKKGKLKIYLGACPGVGKTYAMLQDAKNKLHSGVDVIAGIVESHGRQDIEQLLLNFQVLQKQTIAYKGKTFTEFNLDLAIERKPDLILIDEMAHTNIHGFRHQKRWQDIKELLLHNIDVFTTLNIQHIGSLNDIVSKIIGNKIREIVPDSILELAETIELIDLSPEDILQRLQEGKIYLSQQIEMAKSNFFKKETLISLRELALRVTAQTVRSTATSIEYKGEKILVCINHHTYSEQLLQIAKRTADAWQADWTAVYVDAPLFSTQTQKNIAINYLRTANNLGAKTKVLPGTNTAAELIKFAKNQKITQIILWKSFTQYGNNIAKKILKEKTMFDLYLISPDKKPEVSLGTSDNLQNWWKYWPIFASMIIVVMQILDTQNIFVYISIIVTLVASVLLIKMQKQLELYQFAEKHTAILHELSKQLAVTRGTKMLLDMALNFLGKALEANILAFLPKNGKLEVKAVYNYSDNKNTLLEKDLGIAEWVYNMKQTAGLGTDTLPFADAVYLPLITAKEILGVISVTFTKQETIPTPAELQLLEAAVLQIALAIEVEYLQNYLH